MEGPGTGRKSSGAATVGASRAAAQAAATKWRPLGTACSDAGRARALGAGERAPRADQADRRESLPWASGSVSGPVSSERVSPTPPGRRSGPARQSAMSASHFGRAVSRWRAFT